MYRIGSDCMNISWFSFTFMTSSHGFKLLGVKANVHIGVNTANDLNELKTRLKWG